MGERKNGRKRGYRPKSERGKEREKEKGVKERVTGVCDVNEPLL